MCEKSIAGLLDIMRRLRDPDTGCPWDQEQNFESIAPYTLEEAYEVVDAIQRGSSDDLKDELGDLLFQVVFHAQMADENGWFKFDDVVESICSKMIRRHPHVFADEKIADSAEQSIAWEAHKAAERKGKTTQAASALDQIPVALPALVRAHKIQNRAARTGFDWPDISGVIDKLDEEVEEFKQAGSMEGDTLQRQREELGDLMFTCANLARHLNTDAESLMRDANTKFERRFRALETLAGEGDALQALTIDALEQLWRRVKSEE